MALSRRAGKILWRRLVSPRLVGLTVTQEESPPERFPYVELRAHTAFSFGDGSVTPETLVERAAELGYKAIGITDTADVGGLVRAVLAGRPCGVRILAGAELRMDGRPVALLARDADGYRNLASLVTQSRVGTWTAWDKTRVGKERGKPNVTWQQLRERSAGLQLLTGPASGPLASLIRNGDRAGAERWLVERREVFGRQLAVEVQLHHAGGAEAALAGALIELAERCEVPWVVANDPRYVDESSRVVHDLLTALRHDMNVDEALRAGVLHPNGEWRLLSPGEMQRRWKGREAGLEESARIAGEIQSLDFSWMRPPLPEFNKLVGGDADSFLREKTFDGARTRWCRKPGDVLSGAQVTQLEHELSLIATLGFAGFFLVMWDAMRVARSRKILCQGRGSAANSAVAYCLGITAVDPVKEGLLFERFLSEMRVDGKAEAPDIDVDIEHDRREEVLDYMYDRYDAPYVGDHLHRADVPRAQCRAGCHARAGVSAPSWRSRSPSECIATIRPRRGGASMQELAPPRRGSTWMRRAGGHCCARSPLSRGCRGCARRTSAASCCLGSRLATLSDRADDDGPHHRAVRQG